MRITNTMITNNVLSNIQRNMKRLSTLEYQYMTGNKIQYASDDPIIASRALRYRSTLARIEQYQDNVNQGNAWLNQSAYAIADINDLLFTSGGSSIRSKIQQAASTGINTADDKEKFITEVNQLIQELYSLGNTDYNGRYIFSGYRTDEPAFFLKDDTGASFQITNRYTPTDVDKVTSYYKDPGSPGEEPVEVEYYRIKLPYTDADMSTLPSTFNSMPIVSVSLNAPAPPDPYDPPAGTVYYIEETGELVLEESDYNAWAAAPTTEAISYQKHGFSTGDINPKVYYDCTDLNSGYSYSMLDAAGNDYHIMEYEFGANVKIQVNSLAKDFLTTELITDLKELVFLVENMTYSTEDEIRDALSSATPPLTGDELETAIKEQIEKEKSFYNDILAERFTQSLAKIDKHADVVAKENTTVGARQNRLQLIENRLKNEETNYTELKDNNEKVDAEDVILQYNALLLMYQASLQLGASIMQLSLGNYI